MVEGQVRDGRTDGRSTFVEQKRIKNKDALGAPSLSSSMHSVYSVQVFDVDLLELNTACPRIRCGKASQRCYKLHGQPPRPTPKKATTTTTKRTKSTKTLPFAS